MRRLLIAPLAAALQLTLAMVPMVRGDVRTDLPRIDIVYPPYGTIFDRTCSDFLKQGGADSVSIRLAGGRRADFQALWDREGPGYLTAVFDAIGLEFPYREMQAVLTVSPVSTMSMPLLINVRPFLATGKDAPPPGDFVEKVFHELMHHYVAPVNARSALRKKYAAEPPTTLNHLHVMALEKFVLLKLGKTGELTYLDHLYRTDPPPGSYRRAWEIVNDIEDYTAFLEELKAVAK